MFSSECKNDRVNEENRLCIKTPLGTTDVGVRNEQPVEFAMFPSRFFCGFDIFEVFLSVPTVKQP